MKVQPCPVCELADGFHDHRVHAERVQVPAHLLIRKDDDR